MSSGVVHENAPTSSFGDALVNFVSHGTLRLVARVGSDVHIEGRLWAHGGGHLSIGDRVHIDGGASGVELKVEPGGHLAIGSDVTLGPGTSIEAQERIIIGDGCHIGAHCKLLDNHLHSMEGDHRTRPASVPLMVEDGVVVEDYAVLLPGAWIGRGARIGRGAVVSRRIPPGAMVRAQPVHPARQR